MQTKGRQKQRRAIIRQVRFPAFLFFCAALFLCASAGAQETGISGSLEWERMELNARITLDLAKAGIRLPAGRARAEALLEDEYSALIHPFIMRIQVDSSSTVEDMVNRGELSLRRIGGIIGGARHIPPSLSADLAVLSARYTININSLGAELIRHSKPHSIATPLIPVPAQHYTGIIIFADEKLPVQGAYGSAFVRPCLFPKIWDSRMKLLFERNMLDPRSGQAEGMIRYTSREAVMRPTPQALTGELIARVGENPLRIIARGVFGAVPTDPVIDEEDALLILSNENNRRLLLEGRVVIVLDADGMIEDLP